MHLRHPLLPICLGLLLTRAALTAPAQVNVSAARTTGHSAPAFSLQDAMHQRHSLAEFRRSPVALFFFCGCEPCHRCAALWAQAQQAGFSAKVPTVIVYSGDIASGEAFLSETGLDPKTTTLLFDAREKVADAYSVTVCPRVFILDATRKVRYTNAEPGANPQTTPATVVVSRIIAAIHLLPSSLHMIKDAGYAAPKSEAHNKRRT